MEAVFIFGIILIVKWIHTKIVDPLVDFIFGYSFLKGSKKAQKERIDYVKSAQRVKIWAREAYSPASVIHSPRNYLYTHVQNCHPEVVLETSKITLQVQRWKPSPAYFGPAP